METLKLVKLDLIRLHNAEFGQFLTRIFEDFAKNNFNMEEDADLKRLFDQLKAQSVSFDKALEQVRASEESKKIAQLDKVRDADFQTFKDSVKLHRNTKTEAKKDAYNALKIILDNYKEVQNESYEEETKKINTLLSTLKASNNAAHIATLGIGEYVTELEKANTAFNDLYAHRSYQISQKQTFDVKKLRSEATQTYRIMTEYVLGTAKVKQTDFYKKALDLFNNSRKSFADILARRSAIKGAKE